VGQSASRPDGIRTECHPKRSGPIGYYSLRLSDLSWWMRLLCQYIAMRANAPASRYGRKFRLFTARFGNGDANFQVLASYCFPSLKLLWIVACKIAQSCVPQLVAANYRPAGMNPAVATDQLVLGWNLAATY